MSSSAGPDVGQSGPPPAGQIATLVPTVRSETPCASCGYSLMGVPLAGRCPECGFAVETSLAGADLGWASPAYLRRLECGAGLAFLGLIGTVVVNIALAVITARTSLWGAVPGELVVVDAVAFVPTAAILVGQWWFTSPDPRLPDRSFFRSPRGVARGAIVAHGVCCAGEFGVLLGSTGSATPTGVLASILGLWLVVLLVEFVALMKYTRRLAWRIPDPEIEHAAAVAAWTAPLCFALFAFIAMIGPLIAIVIYAKLLHRLRLTCRGMADRSAARAA
jgi:hypothetical protein